MNLAGRAGEGQEATENIRLSEGLCIQDEDIHEKHTHCQRPPYEQVNECTEGDGGKCPRGNKGHKGLDVNIRTATGRGDRSYEASGGAQEKRHRQPQGPTDEKVVTWRQRADMKPQVHVASHSLYP